MFYLCFYSWLLLYLYVGIYENVIRRYKKIIPHEPKKAMPPPINPAQTGLGIKQILSSKTPAAAPDAVSNPKITFLQHLLIPSSSLLRIVCKSIYSWGLHLHKAAALPPRLQIPFAPVQPCAELYRAILLRWM